MLRKLRNHLSWLLGGAIPRKRSELKRLLEQTADFSQTFAPVELNMLRNVLLLSETRVENVMIHHGKVDWLHADDTFAEVLKEVTVSNHSRYPVIDRNSNKVVGILHVKRLVGLQAAPEAKILSEELLQAARFVPEKKRLDSMLREFQYYRLHMMIVTDEAAKPLGVISIEDVLESIVGEIQDEFDLQEGVAQKIRATNQVNVWEVDGDTELEEFNQHFGMKLDTKRFDTVGGWISNRHGKLPRTGEQLEENNLLLRVLSTDRRRVLSLQVTRQPSVNNS